MRILLVVAVAAVGLGAFAGTFGAHPNASVTPPRPDAARGLHKIKHVIVIMQENRSFDSYFGTFPGAAGIPPGACNPDANGPTCVKPFVDHADVNGGGPHSQASATNDINGGKMDGFVGEAEGGRRGCTDPNNPACTNSATSDVMGYHTSTDIPNYWSYAQQYVLQDHMFEPNASWSLPEHLFMVSEWSAYCGNPLNPSSCVNALQNPNADYPVGGGANDGLPHYAWTALTYLL